MESIGHMVVLLERVVWLRVRDRTEARAIRPVINKVAVVGRRFALAKSEDVEQRYCQRDDCSREGLPKTALQRAEEQQQRHHEKEDSADHKPKQVAVESPSAAFGVVGAVGVAEAQFVFFHWNAPTSTVELPMPKAVKSAFTITGAPAMMRPPMMESLPASVSPRRMAKPPPTTQIVPKMKPMSMTMPNA